MHSNPSAQQLWQQRVAQGGEGAGLLGVLVNQSKDWVGSLSKLIRDIDGRGDGNKRGNSRGAKVKHGRSGGVGIGVRLKLCRQKETVEERNRDLFVFRSDNADIERSDECLETVVASNQCRLADDIGCLRNVCECDDKVARAHLLIGFVFACEWLESVSPVAATAKGRFERDKS